MLGQRDVLRDVDHPVDEASAVGGLVAEDVVDILREIGIESKGEIGQSEIVVCFQTLDEGRLRVEADFAHCAIREIFLFFLCEENIGSFVADAFYAFLADADCGAAVGEVDFRIFDFELFDYIANIASHIFPALFKAPIAEI